MIKSIVLVSGLIVGCQGNKLSSGKNEGSADAGASLPTSFSVKEKAELPKCDSSRSGSLAYAQADSAFYTCDGSQWSVIEIKGPKGDMGVPGVRGEKGESGSDGAKGSSGLQISEVWRFHANSFAANQDLATDASAVAVYLGTIQLVKFSDGSAYVSASGVMIENDSATNTYSENFSHSFFLQNSAFEQEYLAKFDSYADSKIRYRVTLSTFPTFKATVDHNGDFSNNSDLIFSLIKQ